MVFENYALYPHKTVFENMANPLRLRGLDGETIKRKVAKAAELLEIDGLLDRKPVELSGGRSSARRSAAPLSASPSCSCSTSRSRTSMPSCAHTCAASSRSCSASWATMVYVTHDQLEALSMADRIAVMHDGVLQQFGTPREIYDHPVNEWVAGFVGEPR